MKQKNDIDTQHYHRQPSVINNDVKRCIYGIKIGSTHISFNTATFKDYSPTLLISLKLASNSSRKKMSLSFAMFPCVSFTIKENKTQVHPSKKIK